MKILRTLILILLIGLISCSGNKEKTELKKVETDRIVQKEYDRFWITYKYLNNISEKLEVYVSKEKDTIFNQFKLIKNGIIDSTKSRFYKVDLVKSDKPDTYHGIFRFYSENDSNPKNVDKEKTLNLWVFQRSKDSSYYQIFESKASNEVEFELVNYESDQLIGIINELRFIEDGKDSLNVIETTMAVDNKRKTNNIGIQVFDLDKRSPTTVITNSG